MDVLGLGALGLVAVEWMALGWLSGIDWPNGAQVAAFWAPRWALRLLIGSCLTAFAQLGLALAGPGFGAIPVALLAAALGAGALRLIQRRLEPRKSESRRETPGTLDTQLRRLDWPERAGWLVLGLLLMAATTRALLVPEAGWDAFSHWGLRAQAYALAGTIVDAHSEHDYYPPLVPLLEAWLYLQRGFVSIDLGKTLSALIGSAFAVCLAWHLRLSQRRAWLAPWFATGIVLATTALLESFWTGQADLALTTYFGLATLALFQWQRIQSHSWLVQAGAFAAAAALTKFEGLPRIAVVAAALVVEALLARRWAGHTVRAALALLIPAGAAALLWAAFEATHAIAANPEHLGPFQPLAIGGVLVALVEALGGVRTGGGVLVACLAWAVAGRCMVTGRLRLLSLIVLGELAATLLGFLLSGASPEVEVRTSATRLFEQFLPLALFAGALGLSKVRL